MDRLLAFARVEAGLHDPAGAIADILGPGPFAVIMLLASPETDLAQLLRPGVFSAPVIGCTTAGEICAEGYSDGGVVAVALPSALFDVEITRVEPLATFDRDQLIGALIRTRAALAARRPDWEAEFAVLMVDGLSIREDELTAALAAGLGSMPLCGGSAADGTRFLETFVLCDGQFLRDAAVVTLVRSRGRSQVFNLDHVQPTEIRMVVTGADPVRRVVTEINAEPAALEYARLAGRDPQQMTHFSFTDSPLVVRLGGRHHVRAIREAAPNGELLFFSAIDEGLVLTLAKTSDIAGHLDRELTALGRDGPPAAILAFDCVLRRMEAQDKQKSGEVSDILRRHHVIGFSTYGEQLNAMHVNHTMTGVALYLPDEDPAEDDTAAGDRT